MTFIRVAGAIVGGGIFAALSFQNALAQATTPEGRLKILQDQINSLQQQLEQLKTTTDQKFATGILCGRRSRYVRPPSKYLPSLSRIVQRYCDPCPMFFSIMDGELPAAM